MFNPAAKKANTQATTKKSDNKIFDMVLPFPVSNNALHCPTKDGRIILSAKGRAYYSEMYDYINKERDGFETVSGRLSVDLFIHEPDLRKRDINNLTKSLFDALERCEVYTNDSQIDETHIYRRECRALGAVHVIIRKIGEVDTRESMKEIRKMEAKNIKIEDRESFISEAIKKPVSLNRWKR